MTKNERPNLETKQEVLQMPSSGSFSMSLI